MQGLIIRISGKVHNVGFRFHTKLIAEKLGLHGLVKNLIDGTVYIEVEGDPSLLLTFKEWCLSGPKNANVNAVNVEYTRAKGYNSFTILE